MSVAIDGEEWEIKTLSRSHQGEYQAQPFEIMVVRNGVQKWVDPIPFIGKGVLPSEWEEGIKNYFDELVK